VIYQEGRAPCCTHMRGVCVSQGPAQGYLSVFSNDQQGRGCWDSSFAWGTLGLRRCYCRR